MRRLTRVALRTPAVPAASPGIDVVTTTTKAPAPNLSGPNQGTAALSEISDRDKLFLQRAAKVALMLYVESETAQEEATRLLCEPVVVQVLQHDAKHADGVALPLPRKYDVLLSDCVAVRYARRWERKGR
ncbi:hypothetical protein TraAM80_06827 [Trypanosoma rangeli]|uniref:Uncharacterized protein n=1 Tax=Trypanosoma rangeli TaxID=5698 RepID=A0A3R7N7N0_TRYRA|nr:uncharacterized protein TraAM80_06827 [Trypanosoma rangeli]RNF01659.1 hypothetical protein TraAM80_06827 [Trypanosoma rangeli]|eukprot:RNF01659.1 hypothetical protein TraAM80_06827 [Trypanosoma rangeli]